MYVRPPIAARLVSTRTSSRPAGSVPLKFGPTRAKFPPLPPCVREPGRSRHVVPRVDDLHDPPAIARHWRNDQHDRLGGQVDIRERIERVHVHANDLVVLGIREFTVLVELVESVHARSLLGLATFVCASACVAMYTSGRPKT